MADKITNAIEYYKHRNYTGLSLSGKGPGKNLWGDKNLKQKGVTPRFDFSKTIFADIKKDIRLGRINHKQALEVLIDIGESLSMMRHAFPNDDGRMVIWLGALEYAAKLNDLASVHRITRALNPSLHEIKEFPWEHDNIIGDYFKAFSKDNVYWMYSSLRQLDMDVLQRPENSSRKTAIVTDLGFIAEFFPQGSIERLATELIQARILGDTARIEPLYDAVLRISSASDIRDKLVFSIAEDRLNQLFKDNDLQPAKTFLNRIEHGPFLEKNRTYLAHYVGYWRADIARRNFVSTGSAQDLAMVKTYLDTLSLKGLALRPKETDQYYLEVKQLFLLVEYLKLTGQFEKGLALINERIRGTKHPALKKELEFKRHEILVARFTTCDPDQTLTDRNKRLTTAGQLYYDAITISPQHFDLAARTKEAWLDNIRRYYLVDAKLKTWFEIKGRVPAVGQQLESMYSAVIDMKTFTIKQPFAVPDGELRENLLCSMVEFYTASGDTKKAEMIFNGQLKVPAIKTLDALKAGKKPSAVELRILSALAEYPMEGVKTLRTLAAHINTTTIAEKQLKARVLLKAAALSLDATRKAAKNDLQTNDKADAVTSLKVVDELQIGEEDKNAVEISIEYHLLKASLASIEERYRGGDDSTEINLEKARKLAGSKKYFISMSYKKLVELSYAYYYAEVRNWDAYQPHYEELTRGYQYKITNSPIQDEFYFKARLLDLERLYQRALYKSFYTEQEREIKHAANGLLKIKNKAPVLEHLIVKHQAAVATLPRKETIVKSDLEKVDNSEQAAALYNEKLAKLDTGRPFWKRKQALDELIELSITKARTEEEYEEAKRAIMLLYQFPGSVPDPDAGSALIRSVSIFYQHYFGGNGVMPSFEFNPAEQTAAYHMLMSIAYQQEKFKVFKDLYTAIEALRINGGMKRENDPLMQVRELFSRYIE